MDKKILAAGMQKGFVSVVVAYFLAIALGILAGIWENHYLMIVCSSQARSSLDYLSS